MSSGVRKSNEPMALDVLAAPTGLWVHRRPGYPLVGCSPAEPDSVWPGRTEMAEGPIQGTSKANQREVNAPETG